MPELNYANLLELGKEYVKERPISFQSLAHWDFFEWLRIREAAQPQVAAGGAVAPIKCAECGDEILPICEACAGDMRHP